MSSIIIQGPLHTANLDLISENSEKSDKKQEIQSIYIYINIIYK